MKKKMLSVILAVALICTTVAGCGAGKDSKTATSNSDGFNLRVSFASEPMTMDPALNSSTDAGTMVDHLFEGLMKWEDSGEEIDGTDGTVDGADITYGQAESYDKKENEDGTVTYTFHLRDGIKWSDGKDVTAGDFEYAWKRLVDPATAADYSYMIDGVVNAKEIISGEKDPSELAVKAVDDKTFEVTLTTDLPYFENICAFSATMPLREDIIEKNGEQWTFDPSTYISNGPYKLTEWKHNSQIVMSKNENYYDYENLGPDTITFKLMDDANAALAAFKSGELDYIQNVPKSEIPSLISSGDMKIVDFLGTYYVCFQTQKAPFDDPKVREAFTLAVDRTYIVDKVTQTGQVEAGGYVPSGIGDADGGDFREEGGDYYAPTDAGYEANCEKARKLLAEAGYPNGEGFPVVEYLYNTNDVNKAIAEALQNMWEQELGVTVTLNNQEWASFIQTRKNGDFVIACDGWISDYSDPISFLDVLMTGGGNNDAQYSNPEYDNLVRQAKTTSDAAERMKLLHQAEDILIGRDHVINPLYFYTLKYMLADGIEGMYYTPLGYFFFGYTHQAK